MNASVERCADRPKRADLRKQKLLDTARKLFVENGFHATGMAQIAKESGIAVGQIYRDFCSKEAIVAALVQSGCTQFLQLAALQAAMSAGDTDEVLAWLLRFVEGDDDLEGSRLFAEIVAESSRNPRIAAIFTNLQHDLRVNILSALTSLAPEADSTQLQALADVIMTMSLGLLQHRLLHQALEVRCITRALQGIIEQQLSTLRMQSRPALETAPASLSYRASRD